jgi:butyrate kinase
MSSEIKNADSIKDILVINPGSTSTKIAVFTNHNQDILFSTNIVHNADELLEFPTIPSQKEYRSKKMMEFIDSQNYDMKNLSAVMGRGGMIKELGLGGYRVNERMLKRLNSPSLPKHASTLGGLMAHYVAEPLGIPAFIYDAPLSCTINEISMVTGIKGLVKYGQVHVLNQRAMSMEYAKKIGKKYEDLNIVCCHMGGGITVSAQEKGNIIDTLSYDEGPMSPERSGGITLLLFQDLCFSGEYTEEEISSLISGRGGLYSHLGSKNCVEIEKRIQSGDKHAELIYKAMAYQVAKALAQMSVSLKGKVDVFIITGGIAHSKMLTDWIREYAGHLGRIVIMPGEKEMEALANGAYRMLSGKEEIHSFDFVYPDEA